MVRAPAVVPGVDADHPAAGVPVEDLGDAAPVGGGAQHAVADDDGPGVAPGLLRGRQVVEVQAEGGGKVRGRGKATLGEKLLSASLREKYLFDF